MVIEFFRMEKMLRIAGVTVLICVAVLDCGYYFGIRRCNDQLPNRFSPYCVSCYINKGAAGDAVAMFDLALYFSGRNPVRSDEWLKKAVENGNENAILRALDECKLGMFHRNDVEKYLVNAAQVDPKKMSAVAKYFYLGGYGGPVDLKRAGSFHPGNDSEISSLCRVATKYGELVTLKVGTEADKQDAIKLLRECVIKLDTSDVQYKNTVTLLSKVEFLERPE